MATDARHSPLQPVTAWSPQNSCWGSLVLYNRGRNDFEIHISQIIAHRDGQDEGRSGD